ncbi:MAG: hypothetical protein ACK5JU_01615 [Bacteroidales bacterium]
MNPAQGGTHPTTQRSGGFMATEGIECFTRGLIFASPTLLIIGMEYR